VGTPTPWQVPESPIPLGKRGRKGKSGYRRVGITIRVSGGGVRVPPPLEGPAYAGPSLCPGHARQCGTVDLNRSEHLAGRSGTVAGDPPGPGRRIESYTAHQLNRLLCGVVGLGVVLLGSATGSPGVRLDRSATTSQTPLTAAPAAWRVVPVAPLPPPSSAGATLNSISCATARECIAVGDAIGGGPIAGRWDGETWQWLSTPPVPATDHPGSTMDGVACASSDDCIAVGGGDSEPAQRAFADRWDGSQWVALTPWSPKRSDLIDVSCLRSGQCLAVGDRVTSGGKFGPPIAEWWNGRGWHRAAAPFATGVRVSCVSARFCLSIGGNSDAVVQSWDGHRWRAPLILDRQSLVLGVSCVSSRHCVAVGAPVNLRPRVLAYVLTGRRWRTWSDGAAFGARVGLLRYRGRLRGRRDYWLPRRPRRAMERSRLDPRAPTELRSGSRTARSVVYVGEGLRRRWERRQRRYPRRGARMTRARRSAAAEPPY